MHSKREFSDLNDTVLFLSLPESAEVSFTICYTLKERLER